ncbi:MAG TPA: response regulator [Rhodothermales bacterium]|nr:response regulator [Rhodothermales bacterium]
MHFLIVEDNPHTARLLQIHLSSFGTVDIAGNAREALLKAGAITYDFFFLDIQLGPGPDGVSLMRTLRADLRYADRPMIAFTASCGPDYKEQFRRDGFDGFLGKPFTKDDVRDVIVSNNVDLGHWHATSAPRQGSGS